MSRDRSMTSGVPKHWHPNFYDPTILRLCFFLFFEVEHETKKKVAKGKSLKQLQYNISLGGTCIIQVAISMQE